MTPPPDARAVALGVLTDTKRGERLRLMASLARVVRARIDDILAEGFTRRVVTEQEQRGLVRARSGVVEVLCTDEDVLAKWIVRARDEDLTIANLPRVDPLPAPSKAKAVKPEETPKPAPPRRKKQAEARVTHVAVDGDGFTMLLCLGPMSPKDFEEAGLWSVYQAFLRGEEPSVKVG